MRSAFVRSSADTRAGNNGCPGEGLMAFRSFAGGLAISLDHTTEGLGRRSPARVAHGVLGIDGRLESHGATRMRSAPRIMPAVEQVGQASRPVDRVGKPGVWKGCQRFDVRGVALCQGSGAAAR